MGDELNLDELAQFCADLVIEDSFVDVYTHGKEGSVHIGGYINGEYAGAGTKDYVPIDRAEKLVKLLNALPRLIELARKGLAMPELKEGQELAILNPPQAAEQWFIDTDDI